MKSLSMPLTDASQIVCISLKLYHFVLLSFQIFRTERIKNSQNPTFTKGFILEYCFEELQKLKFSVYDIDNKTPDLKDDDFLGSMECTLGQVSFNHIFSSDIARGHMCPGRHL